MLPCVRGGPTPARGLRSRPRESKGSDSPDHDPVNWLWVRLHGTAPAGAGGACAAPHVRLALEQYAHASRGALRVASYERTASASTASPAS
jgi:hypothetical protein